MAQRGRGAGAVRPATRAERVARTDTGRRSGEDIASARARIRGVIEPVTVAAGLDLEDVVVTRMGRRHLIRVVVDADGGVDHDGLGALSQKISAVLDAAEEPGGELCGLGVLESYTLEVSSPGVSRPLTLPRHWRRSVGRLVKVKAGERTVRGRIVSADEEAVTLNVDGQEQTYPLGELGPGRVQVEFRDIGDEEDEA